MKTHAIYYKVEDREASIAFYQQKLGLTLIREENAYAVMAGQSRTAPYLIIEESPDWLGNRDVQGPKKHVQTDIRMPISDIEQLILRQEEELVLFKGTNGYAFEVVSPQGDRYLVHAEDDPTCLVPVSAYSGNRALNSDYKGVATWNYSGICLRTPEEEKSREFYQKLFGLLSPLTINIERGEGGDLLASVDDLRDVAVLSFSVPEVMDLAGLYQAAKEISSDVYLDKKAHFLMLKDPSGVEVWLSKYPDRY